MDAALKSLLDKHKQGGNTLGKFFQTTAFIIAIGGLIYGIILGAVCQYNAGSSWNTDYKFNIGLMFQTWIFSDIIALAFFLGAHLLDALERTSIENILS